MFNRAIWMCVIAHLLLVPATIGASEPEESIQPLSAVDIEARCESFIGDPEGADSEACVAFMQGFLAGLDARSSTARSAAETAESSFAQRATRTRAAGQLQRFQTLQGDEYCIPAGVSGVEVIQRVTAYLGAFSDGQKKNKSSVELIHHALVQSWPCNNGNG